MQTAIKTALNCLDRADISGYFQHLKAAVPAQHLTRYNALQQEFVSGRSPWNFDQQLRTFADMLAESDGATNAPSGAAPVAPAALRRVSNHPLRVFISFSENEKGHREYSKAIKNHLRTLIQEKQIQVWSRADLNFGEVTPQIQRELEQADVFVALMSSDYFSDDQVQQLDEAIARRRQAEGNLIVVPVILRPFNWEYTWLKDFPPLPRDKSSIKSPENDEAWIELEMLLRAILKDKQGVPPIVPVTPAAPATSTGLVPPTPHTYPPTAPATTAPPMTTPATTTPSTWGKIIQFLRDIPVIIKGIGALAAAVLAIWTFFKPAAAVEPQKVALQGELVSAVDGRRVDNVEIWLKDHRDLNCNLRTGENTFTIKPIDPKMDNGLATLVVDYKGPAYSEELVSSNLINLNNYKVEGGIINIGEVYIPEPAKIKPTTPQVSNGGTKGKKASPIVLTGYLDLGYPGKNLRDVRRVFLTDSPTNDDKNVATGAFKIPLEKPFSDGLYKISVEFYDGTITTPVLQKTVQLPGANGELPLGTLTFRR